MKFSLKSGRTKSTHHINFFPDTQHPDLPLSPNPQQPSPDPRPRDLNRSSTLSDRFGSGYSGDRRSIAVIPGGDSSVDPNLPYSPDDIALPSPGLSGGLTRSQTVLRREGARWGDNAGSSPQPATSTTWSPDFAELPSPTEEHVDAFIPGREPMPMSAANTPGKSSSDSGQSSALDRWSQRRLQRLNTEQGFREQRQGSGTSILSPTATASDHSGYGNNAYASQDGQPQHHHQPQPPQPHPSQQPAYQSSRTAQASHANAGFAIQAQSVGAPSRNGSYAHIDNSQLPSQLTQTPAPDSAPPYASLETSRPALPMQSRSFSHPPGAEEASMSASNNGGPPASKSSRSAASNRQSMHNGLGLREGPSLAAGTQSGGQAGYSASSASHKANSQQQQTGDVGRLTPQPAQTSEDMTEEEVNQLIKDHKELREKYTKVKKYYFEKEDQVKQLQNSLAHQRLSQSRTSLDDTEYTTRFNRLDGLIAQLAFSIRKSWRSIPSWLISSVNKDAVATGKQEMTAAGRAFISCWLVEEVFDKYFHPDLEPALSTQLKAIQKSIRRVAPFSQTTEEEENLTSKVVNWRLATLEGLQDALRSPQCPTHRANLTDELKEQLVSALVVHLQQPPPSDLEGGVHMIIELVVSIAIHLPLESRDVVIEYFMPGYSIMQDQMKLESGIPPLTISIADDAAERGSITSAVSDAAESTDNNSNSHVDGFHKKRSMLSAIAGTGKAKSGGGGGSDARARHAAGAGGSSGSLNRPDSSSGSKDQPPRVRMSAGFGVQIRGRGVLVKAPVFATA